MIPKNPLKNLALNKEEKEIEKAFGGKYAVRPDQDKRIEFLKKAIQNTKKSRKTKTITIRLDQEDLYKLKLRAKKNKIPYQTLLGLIVSQYVEGEKPIIL